MYQAFHLTTHQSIPRSISAPITNSTISFPPAHFPPFQSILIKTPKPTQCHVFPVPTIAPTALASPRPTAPIPKKQKKRPFALNLALPHRTHVPTAFIIISFLL